MKGRKNRLGIGPPRIAANVTAAALLFLALMAFMGWTASVRSAGGVYALTEHGGTDANTNGVTGASRPANTPVGGYTIDAVEFPKKQCIHCHDQHASYENAAHTPENKLLYDPGGVDPNKFCYVCHQNQSAAGGSYQYPSWAGQANFTAGSHGTNASVLWPGANPAAKAAGDQNKCINCHNPHGRSFADSTDSAAGQAGAGYVASDPIPSMLTRVEEKNCLTCHDATGPAATDINSTLLYNTNNSGTGVFYNHPIVTYAAANDRTPSVHKRTETFPLAGGGQTAMHVECVDCHNPHYARSGTHVAPTNLISNVLLGAWGIVISGGWPNTQAKGSGTLQPAPSFAGSPVQLTNTASQYEYQLCLRCHSSYSADRTYAAPNDTTDLSREFNPNNAAHHPVAGVGNNPSPQIVNNFRAPFTRDSVITCTDCHESSVATDPKGPHGSANKWLLGTFCDTGAGANCAVPEQTVFCFKCHKFSVYFSGAAGSRMTHPANGGMVDNARNAWGIWCMSCHGGGTEGGIHGANAGVGTSGTSALGTHFMNGAAIKGFTEGVFPGNGTCWTKNANDAYDLNCTQHSGGGGRSFTLNFNY